MMDGFSELMEKIKQTGRNYDLDKITQAEAQEILDAAAAAYGLSRSWTEACVAEAMEAQAASGLELPDGQVSRGTAASMAAALVEEVYGS